MSVIESPQAANLLSRVQNILLKPKSEWDVIDAEPATVQSLFLGYACVLAAIPAIAGAIGKFMPVCVLGICVHYNPLFIVIGAVVNYVLSLAGVYGIGMVIDALAPSFGGQKDQLKAMKVAVYSFTASWLAGIFTILPMLGLLSLVGLYSLYLLYLGLPKLMKSPQDKAMAYTAVSILCGIVVFIVVGVIASIVMGLGVAAPGAATIGAPATTVGVR